VSLGCTDVRCTAVACMGVLHGCWAAGRHDGGL